jgi:hypothetical protein
MPKLPLAAVALAMLSLPVAAFAEDEVAPSDESTFAQPPADPPVADPAVADPDVAPPTDPALAAPGMTQPAAPAAPTDEYSCAWRWHHHAVRRRGFIGIGLAKGHVGLDDDTDGRQKALILRAQGRRGFGIELEFARAEIGDDHVRTAGGALYKAFGRRHLMPYVLVGGGRGEIERAGGGDDGVRYGEFGGGLMLKLRRFAIGVDVRKGVRRVEDRTPEVMATFPGAPAVVTPPDDDERDRYVRGRVMALITF